MLIQFATVSPISLPLVKHTEDQHDHLIHGLVGLFRTSYCVITWLNDDIAVPVNIPASRKRYTTLIMDVMSLCLCLFC